MSLGGTRPAVLCSTGCKIATVTNTLLKLKQGGLTPLNDGLFFAAEFVARHRRPGVRAVLILFSKRHDQQPFETRGSCRSGATLYAIDIAVAEKESESSRLLRGMSDASGGRYVSIRDGAATALRAALNDLHSSYVVTYQPASLPNGFHSLRLLPTRNLNLKFHNRSGYYYEPHVR